MWDGLYTATLDMLCLISNTLVSTITCYLVVNFDFDSSLRCELAYIMDNGVIYIFLPAYWLIGYLLHPN